MADAPSAPTAPKAVKLTTEKDGIEVLKTFIWSADKESTNQTFLRGSTLVGFPSASVKSYAEKGLVALPVKD